MNKVSWSIFVAVTVLILAGLVVFSQREKVDVSNFNQDSAIGAVEESGSIADHTFGNEKAKVVIVEYADFQCPACKSSNDNITEAIKDYSDDVLFIYRHFPLTQMHPNAMAAAAAAEAAGIQGSYWEMHDLLFENQQQWSSIDSTKRTATFKEYAQKMGLDTARFEEDMVSANVTKKIKFDQALGKKQEVTGTPTLFVNGVAVDQEELASVESFKGLIKSKL